MCWIGFTAYFWGRHGSRMRRRRRRASPAGLVVDMRRWRDEHVSAGWKLGGNYLFTISRVIFVFISSIFIYSIFCVRLSCDGGGETESKTWKELFWLQLFRHDWADGFLCLCFIKLCNLSTLTNGNLRNALL